MRTVAIVALQVGLLFLGACAWKSNPPQTGAVTVELTASPFSPPVVLTPATVETIQATVYDQSNQGVTWTISPLNFGTLSTQTSTNSAANSLTTAIVTYTAPANFSATTTVTITATSVSNPVVTASLPIKVTPIVVVLETPVNGNFIPVADQSISPGGQQLSLIANATTVLGLSPGVTWAISPASGAGTLAGQTASTANYVPPSAVSSPVTATVTATAVANSSATAVLRITVLPSGFGPGAGPNVAAISVNGGPIPGQIYPNAAFTSVTICSTGSQAASQPACQNVDGILVDTGSYGLRILQSEVSQIKLQTFVDDIGNILQNCASNVDGSYLWGTVSQADVYVAGEFVPGLYIQAISSSPEVVPDGCSNGGTTNLNTPQLLGANGILGVGPEPTDCTLAGVNLCDGSTQATPPNLYYSCPTTGCATTDSPVTVPATGLSGQAGQVTNPVKFMQNTIAFTSDDNGVILQFPSVSEPESSVIGTLTFGIGTESNNGLGTATIYYLDSNDNFTTTFNGQTLTSSFIDSGSNALYFPDSLSTCSVNTQFFCPSSLTSLSAINQGAAIAGTTQGQSTVPFSVDNADNLLSANPGDAAFGTLAGPLGTFQSCSNGTGSCVFDWGLPFFYGNTVYTHIDACPPPEPPPASPTTCAASNQPYWAY